MPADPRIEWGTGAPPPEFAAFTASAPDRELPRPDADWGIARAGDEPVGRLATYIRRDLSGAPGITGLIGHYDARDTATGAAMLRAAAARLHACGAQRVLGPMNGSTWARYRLALPPLPGEPGELPFLGEPVNPAEYPAHFAAAGFRAAAHYESRISYDLGIANPNAAAAAVSLAGQGIRIAPVDLTRFEDELRDLHGLSIRAFPENLYYAPIDAEAFGAMYRPMLALIDPELVLLARAGDGGLVAYVFAYVDPYGVRDGRPYRLIVKTLATDPAWRGLGLGGMLVDRLHAAARDRRLGAIVHALMQADNNSVRISAHTAQVFRRYALYEHAAADGD